VELAFDEGRWRITKGGIQPARFDTPEHALETFFRAAEAKRLVDVRRAMPARHRTALTEDEKLHAHLSSSAERIERARRLIGTLSPGRAVIQGDRADLAYGTGLSVTFEREEGEWRIVDLE
jgi:hypothetical protein